MKETGGGIGATGHAGGWEQWDEELIPNYFRGQQSMLYLGIIHMWDKQKTYIFVTRKDPMPHDCMIGDGGGTFNISDNLDTF